MLIGDCYEWSDKAKDVCPTASPLGLPILSNILQFSFLPWFLLIPLLDQNFVLAELICLYPKDMMALPSFKEVYSHPALI